MAQDADAGSADSWDKVLFLLLGWLLATLSPLIADAIRRHRASAEIKSALLAELREVKFRMAIANYHIETKYGKVDRAYLEWLRPIVAAYSGPSRTDRILKSIDMQLAASDQVIAALAEKDRATGEHGLTLKKYPAPLLEEKVGTFSSLPTKVQVLLLEIRTHIHMLEEEVDQSRFYFQLTFNSSIVGATREGVNNNLSQTYKQYGDRARIIVNRIEALEDAWA